jgi:hypothetical protein
LLELRGLLSATSWPGLVNPQAELEPNDTLDVATSIGAVRETQAGEFVGTIGAGTGASNDVDWFSFTLAAPERINVAALTNSTGAVSPVVLTLYGDQMTTFDPAIPLGHALLGRQQATSSVSAQLTVNLNAGTYYVAVSGAGNRFFHPFLADSGTSGLATDYGVRVTATAASFSVPNGQLPTTKWESGKLGNDTKATSINLGDVTSARHLQVEGTIGDDPFYSLTSTNPLVSNPAADVDLYHVRLTGDGRFAFLAEAFAGRIGSPLDPALTLFKVDTAGALQQVATNNNTLNTVTDTTGQLPLFSDSVVFSGLTAGDYYLAVSSAGNEAEGGPSGVFNPNTAHSGANGYSTGAYVLDLSVKPDSVSPSVIATSLTEGSTLDRAPARFTVQFSETVNVRQLAYLESQETGDRTVRPVFILGADGTRYYPRLQSYNIATSLATFLMLDALPNGASQLHVSGPSGVADFAGNPVLGNDASGDFVTRFTVAGPTRGSASGQTMWFNQAANDTPATAQDLGVLFPRELLSGVSVIRNAATSSDSADYFRFDLLQSRTFALSVQNTGAAGTPRLTLFNAQGNEQSLLSLAGGTLRLGNLPAGGYVLRVSGWDSSVASNVSYRAQIKLIGASENPTPLTSGAAPAVSIQLVGGAANTEVVPILFNSSESSETLAIPSGLLAGLNAPALGSPAFVANASAPRDTAIVRLFGFSDRLFSLIDSSLPRADEGTAVTRVELTDSELLDLLDLAQSKSTPTAPADEADSTGEPVDSSETINTDDAAPTPIQNSETPAKTAPAQPVTKARPKNTPTRSQKLEERLNEQRADQQDVSSAVPFALAAAIAAARRSPSSKKERLQ